MTTPTGPIKTAPPEGGSFGISWEALTQYDDAIHAAADPVGWPIERVRGHITIESRGNPRAFQHNTSNGNSYGLMQVVPYTTTVAPGVGWDGWHDLVVQKSGVRPNAPRDTIAQQLYDPKVNIAVGVAILESFYQQYGSLNAASSAFFLGNPNWKGQDTVNGNTGASYKKSLDGLIAEQKAFNPAPSADDILHLIAGPTAVVAFGFNQPNLSCNGPCRFYAYGVGHGTSGDSMHTGIDIGVPRGTPIHTPLPGRVTCVGNAGEVIWGEGCGAYADEQGGIGNVTVMCDAAGVKLVFGHCSTAKVQLGQNVNAGDVVALSGTNRSDHCHLDVTTQRNGSYWLNDPLPTLVAVMSGQPLPEPAPSYPDAYPVPQPSELTTFLTVHVTADRVPVLQRGDMGAAKVGPDIAKGDTFEAAELVLGDDKSWYWIGRNLRGRVPVVGTHAEGAPDFGSGQTTCPPDRAPALLAAVDAALRTYR